MREGDQRCRNCSIELHRRIPKGRGKAGRFRRSTICVDVLRGRVHRLDQTDDGQNFNTGKSSELFLRKSVEDN